ncbi:iron chelate uptake ABC transporter family permease subunit [Microbacterium sp. Kw_RZR3]|uniref:FecCD family ABC transporter permease n=1 Tax=Microbacterium sp. Kw_RZR3 TaxID=3032903 RepID=UPI0023DBC86F|nr:iron chelate uptake ABC transporter family permease subunit [Microbacterium sp. Kw_RZR3]MDF2046272.1 iron chelate uptake ABC transporter family permease subunit [Microbacterium sp. Kw_RZR3]
MTAIVRVPPRLRRRRLLAALVVGGVLVVSVTGTLTLGDLGVTPTGALAALVGAGDAGTVLVVQQWRLPRAVLGIVVGALLALSGALFQTVTRNPLGSPDILGFSVGAFTGVLAVTLAGATSVLALTGGAIGGGLVAAVLVFVLCARTGFGGVAVVLTGIGVSAMLAAVNVVLVVRLDDVRARAAAVWATGSLNGVGADGILPAVLSLASGALVIAALARSLHLLEFGDERATSLGVRPPVLRWGAMVIGVALISVATAVAGPIGFIALAAPQIARRVWRTGTIPFAASAFVGAALLGASDLIASRALAPVMLPTGLVTVCLGGVYLAWLLTSRERTRR